MKMSLEKEQVLLLACFFKLFCYRCHLGTHFEKNLDTKELTCFPKRGCFLCMSTMFEHGYV